MNFIIDNSSTNTANNIISGVSDTLVYNSLLLTSSNTLQSNILNTSNYASNISNVLLNLINANSVNATASVNTSNYASNISNVLLNLINSNSGSLNYTIERQYPPKIWDTIDASYTTITYNGFESYNINYVITTASYGLGSYSVAYSNRFVLNGIYYGGAQPNNLFDYITSQDNSSGTGDFYNNSVTGFNSSGDYIGQRYLSAISYKGEWFYIRLPYQIKLTKYIIIGLIGSNNIFIPRSPALWKMYGSNDGINWEEIIDASNSTTKLTSTDYINVSSKYTKILNNPSKSYSYIGMCINGIVSGAELQFVELQLFGIELIDYPFIYSTISNLSTIYYNKTQTNTLITNTSNYATNISNILLTNNSNFTLGITINTSNYATNISNILLTNINTKESILSFTAPLTRTTNTIGINLASYSTTGTDTNYLLKSGGTMTGQLILSTTTGNNSLYISSTLNNANNCINIKNNSTYNAYIGVGGSAFAGNYQNNFFIESASSSIILNTNGRTSTSTPNLIVSSTGKIGIGTTNPLQILDVYNDTNLNNYIRVRSDLAREAGIIFDRTGANWTIFNKGTGFSSSNNLTIDSSAKVGILEITQSGNIGIGTTVTPNLLNLYDTVQNKARLTLTGQEFYQAGNTSTDGIGLVLGVNRTDNRQLFICDTSKLAQNATNSMIRITVGGTSTSIDSTSTDGTTRLGLDIGGTFKSQTNAYGSINKLLKFHNVQTSDTKAFMENLIFNEGAVVGGTFGGDTFITGYWGVAVNLNSGGSTNGVGGGNNSQSYEPGYSAFTINMRSSTSQTTFDKRLLTVLPGGNVGIGTTNPANILQVADGSRLRISNGPTDFTLIGTKDVEDNNNTKIVLSGYTRGSPHAGNIDYVSTAGFHRFYTNGSTERMRIANDGNVGIGITNPNNILHISSGSAGKPLIQFTQTTAWDNANPTLSVSGYTNLGGFRINGADAGASIYQINTNTDISFLQNAGNTTGGNIKFTVIGAGGNIIFNTSSTERMKIANDGLITTTGNFDCGGGIAITGSTGFYETSAITPANLTNTYINFKFAGTVTDWCYLRQIGTTNAYKLALDFHDDADDARFCIRSIQSAANDPDIIREVFSVDNGDVTATGIIKGTTIAATYTTNYAAPATGIAGGTGDKIILYPGTASAYPYSIGINANIMWYSVPSTSTHHLCVNGTSITIISSTGLSTTGTINASTNLQEAGTNLSAKYLQLAGGNMTGALKITKASPSLLRIETNLSQPNEVSGIEFGIPAFTTAGTAKITSTARSGDVADLQFSTSSSINNSTIKMTIAGDGNVGIGITNPGIYKLNVNGDIYLNGTLNAATNLQESGTNLSAKYLQLAGSTMTGVLKFNNIVANKVISLYDAATPNNFQFVGIGANNGLVLNNFASGDAFQFRVGATTTSSIELMRLTGTGNLGIGTTDTSVNILQVGKGGRLKIGNGVDSHTMIGTQDDDTSYEHNFASTNTKIILYSISSGTATGSIKYFAPASQGKHMFYTGGAQSLIIDSDGTVKSGNNITIFDRSGTLYNNGVSVDLKYATKETDIVNTSNYALNISNILLTNINAIGTSINTSNYASNISNILVNLISSNSGSATLTVNTSNYATNISNILLTNINTKESILSFTAPLTRTTNTIGINLASYSTTGTDTNYLLKSGGTMTGAIKFAVDTWNKSATDDLDRIYIFSNSGLILRIGDNASSKFIIFDNGYQDIFNVSKTGIINDNKVSTFGGAINIPMNTWNKSTGDNLDRLYYSSNSGLILRIGNDANSKFTIFDKGYQDIFNIATSGLVTTTGNIDCGGGIALTGSAGFINTTAVDSSNLTNTYINFKTAGTVSDWCYLRQIGGTDAIKLALDFHDDVGDARFCIRNIASVTNPDTTNEVFTVNNGNVSCSGTLQTGGNLGVGISATNGINLAIEKYLRIEGTATNNPSKALSIGGYGLVEVDAPGTHGGRFKIDNDGNVTCKGNFTNGSSSYIYAGGLRLGGYDTANTIWQNTGDLGISANTGNNIKFVIGSGSEKMRILSNGNIGIGTTNTDVNILQVGKGGRLKIGNGVDSHTMIGTQDDDTSYEHNFASTNTKIILYSISSGTATGSIKYFAPASQGKHMFYTGGAQSLIIDSDGTVKSGNNITIFDRSGTLYNNGVSVDLKYATKETDIVNTSNYTLNISNILLANINTIGINLASYSTTGTDTNYLLKSGGTMTGALTTTGVNIGSISINNYLFNNQGANNTAYNNFDNIDKFGYTFIAGTTNGPATGATQYYSWYIGLGNDYPFNTTPNGTYGMQFAIGRSETNPKLCIRRKEANVWQGWEGLTAEKAVSLTSGDKTISGILTATTFSGSGASLTNIPFSALTGTTPYLKLDGTNSMTGQLSISTTTYNPLFITTATTNNVVAIELKNNSTYSAFIGIGCTAYSGNYQNNLYFQSPQSLIFNTNANGTAATPSLIINTSGNVGIGTANPGVYKLNVNGSLNATTIICSNIETTSNIDCGGGIAITGSTAFWQPGGTVTDTAVDSGNTTNTYINFKGAGAGTDWCYLRQIGQTELYKLALDFHDDNNDARFCIRSVRSAVAGGVDVINEVFAVDNGDLTISKASPILTIKGNLETQNTIIYLGTPVNSTSALKTAIIAEGKSTWSRANLHFCLNNMGDRGAGVVPDGNSTNYNASIADARMTITYTGNVGIGTTNPSYRLHITAGKTVASTAFAMKVSGGFISDAGNHGTLIGLGSEDGSFTKCAIGHVRNDSDDRGDIVFLAANTTGSGSCSMSDEKMRVSKFGFVGIGNTNPFYPLCIGSPVSTSDGVLVISKRDGGGGARNFKMGYDGNYNFQLGDFGGANSSTNTWSNQLTIAYINGNVGIGTADQAYKLYVNGTTYINGLLNINAYETSVGGNKGIIFRDSYNVAGTNNYNCSILTYDHVGTTSSDGLSINGYDGVSFCTGANTRQERMRIDTSGNVAIGTTSIIAGFKLDCRGGIYAQSLLIGDANTITANNNNVSGNYQLMINPPTATAAASLQTILQGTGYNQNLTLQSLGGNVGIGTTNPSTYKLYVNGTTYINGNTTINSAKLIVGNDNSFPDLQLGSTNGNNLGVATTAGSFSGASAINDLVLRSLNKLILQSGGGNTPAITITTGNYVGIGTNNPSQILQVGDAARLRIANDSNDYSLIGTKNVDDADNTRIVISGKGRTNYNGNIDYITTTTGSHLFYSSVGTTVERMRINNVGNVGIGTNNPGTRLHIEHASTVFNGSNGGLYLYNPNNSSSHCSVLGARIGGSNANKAGVSLDVNAAYGWSMYINGTDTNKTLRFNSSWDASGVDRLQIRGSDGYTIFSGNMQIGSATASASLIIGNNSGATSLTLTDIANAVWKMDTANLRLNFYNDTTTSQTFVNKMQLTQAGNLLVSGDISAFANMSDRRLKHNINNLSLNCIELLNKIQPVEFIWNDMDEIMEIKRNTYDHGFIAQDIELLLPNLVNQYDKYKSIKYEKLTPYLVKGSQELYNQLQELREENIRQKNQINDLQNQINTIKQYINMS